MAKERIDIVFEGLTPLILDSKLATALVKQHADNCLLWSDFGWVKVFKYHMLEILAAEEQIEVSKVPKFSTFRFKRVAKEEDEI